MNQISWRHHYLPVFYLKGFTKESGNLKIYNVVTKKFVQKGKEFSPESYFFEKDANSIFKNNTKSDFVENGYADLENKIAKLITKINSSDDLTRYDVNEDDMPMLNLFVSLMYWRLPHRKEELDIILKNNDLINLGLAIKNSDGTANTDFEQEIKNDPEFLKAYKFFHSLIDSVRGLNCRTPYTIIPKQANLPFLCSDNPVIFENLSPNTFEDDYIFPLSGTRFFIKSNKRENFHHFLWLLIDIVIYKQAVKYVSCTHQEYIEMLDNSFEKYNMTLDELKAEIFKRLQ
ncbi:DUF4238 domain-containing protein [Flavobacterium sp. FlaQc-47]|uniref:DUF4238 domain-containing protein n=1 Tax=Flavobacterium sp. FlaQc-47 TaxID=3374180 RepID=UPI0037565DC6